MSSPRGESPPLRFLLERMAHIRCFCLTVRASANEQLVAADAVAHGRTVTLRCRLEGPASKCPGAITSRSCSLRLDVGEELECGTAVVCPVSDGFGYARLLLAPEAVPGVLGVLNTAAPKIVIFWGKSGDNRWGSPAPCKPVAITTLDCGRESERLREEAGMYHRAAAQRRKERAALASAHLCCGACAREQRTASLLHVEGARFLPDPEGVQDDFLADFMQMGTSHTLSLPRPQHQMPHAHHGKQHAEAISARAGFQRTCFLGRHSLHLQAAPPSRHVSLSLKEAFRAPSRHAHAVKTDTCLWAPLCCRSCGSTLGAAQLDARDEEEMAVLLQDDSDELLFVKSALSERQAPIWFDSGAAPELGCSLQLLKGAITCTPDAAPVCGTPVTGRNEDGQVAKTGVDPSIHLNLDVHPLLAAASAAFSGYSMATLVADRILRGAEEDEGEHMRRFALVASDVAADGTADGNGTAEGSEALILLLSPYVTLATNHEAADTDEAADAIKVMYTIDPGVMAALGLTGAMDRGETEGRGSTPMRRLILPDVTDRQAVIRFLQGSSEMLHPETRSVGALLVGYLPIAPTWD